MTSGDVLQKPNHSSSRAYTIAGPHGSPCPGHWGLVDDPVPHCSVSLPSTAGCGTPQPLHGASTSLMHQVLLMSFSV